MDRDTLEKAFEHISDRHISDAAKPKRRRPYWMGAVAAVTAAAVLICIFVFPVTRNTAGDPLPTGAIRLAAAPRNIYPPLKLNYATTEEYKTALAEWNNLQLLRGQRTNEALESLVPFFKNSAATFLSGSENKLWSPVNAYVGLAMLAELAGGESRQQILDLFGVNSIEALREQVAAVFESAYFNNGKEISALANSIWLREGLVYDEAAIQNLAHYYYASSFQGNLASDEMAQAIASWLNQNTGGLLADYPPQKLSPYTVFVLYSTIYFQAQWQDKFPSNGTTGIFHGTAGDKEVSYMHHKEFRTLYYWDESFGAVSLGLENGSRMWFILPGEGKNPEDVLAEGAYMDMILGKRCENKQSYRINMTVPKFDISGKQDLIPGLKELGITDVFEPGSANLSSLTGNTPIFVDFVNQAVRVQIDTEGVTGAAYIEIGGVESAPFEGDVMDFVLDRPFLFVITANNIPLFSGVVNNP